MSGKIASRKSARPALVPRHVAVVMDGNGRWATRRLLPRTAGHKFGADALKRLVRGCVQQGVQYLTVFAFSSENWKRPAEEVSALMELFVQALQRETPELAAQGVCLRFLGDREPLNARMRHHGQRSIALPKLLQVAFERNEALLEQRNRRSEPQHQPGIDGVVAGRPDVE